MRRRRSSPRVDAGIESSVPMTPAPVIMRLIPDDYAVLSANSESAAVVVMGGVVTNYRIRRPYFKSIDRPPFPSLRIIVTGTPSATGVAPYGWRVRAGRTFSQKMPLPYPDLLIRLPAIMPSSPANVIPAPSQTLSITRPWLDQISPFLVTRIRQIGGLAPGTVLLI